MNPLGPFNRLGSMPSSGSGAPGNGGNSGGGATGGGAGGNTGSPYMPRVISGSAGAGSGQGGSASGQNLSGAFGYTGSAAAAAAAAAAAVQAQNQASGEGTAGGQGGGNQLSGMAGAGSNAFGRNFPFGGPSNQANFSNAPNPTGNANLDINDFPALGNNANGGGNGQQGGQQQALNSSLSYASQAGTLGLSGVDGSLGNRSFSNDDFPALTGELGSASQEQVSAAAALQHQHLAREQHRRELLGAMSGRSNGTQALSAARGGFGERDRVRPETAASWHRPAFSDRCMLT